MIDQLQQIEYYESTHFDKVSYVKINTGELLIGFVFDHEVKGKTAIDFPRKLVYNELTTNFSVHLVQPNASLDTISLKNEDCVWISNPIDAIKAYFIKTLYDEQKELLNDVISSGNNTIH